MKVYLQSRYCRIMEMRDVAMSLCSAGHVIVSSWIYGSLIETPTPDAAQTDVDDIDRADVIIHFAEPTHSSGRYFELGYAYAKGKPCIIVGDAKCVFFALPGVVRVSSVSAAIEAVGAKVEVVR